MRVVDDRFKTIGNVAFLRVAIVLFVSCHVERVIAFATFTTINVSTCNAMSFVAKYARFVVFNAR
jgi:hypothetical protein